MRPCSATNRRACSRIGAWCAPMASIWNRNRISELYVAEKAYAAHPERLYVIDRATGEVAFKGEMGPFGYLPSALRQFLETL